MNRYKKCTEKPPFSLLILLLHPIILYVIERISQKEYKTKIIRLEIKKLQYDINKEAAKISELSSRKID